MKLKLKNDHHKICVNIHSDLELVILDNRHRKQAYKKLILFVVITKKNCCIYMFR